MRTSLLYRTTALSIVFLCSCLWPAHGADTPRLLKDGAKVIVPAPADEAIRHLSWPKIVRAEDSTLVLAYSAGVGHNQGGSGLAVSLSDDDGETFSPPRLLCYFPRDDARFADVGNVALGLGEDGGIVLLAMAYRGNENNTVLGWRSSDHGRTWQRTDTGAIAENKTGSVFGHVFSVPEKGLAVCGHYRQPKGDGLWISYSQDNGESWQPPETITERKFFEPVFIFASGQLLGFARENAARAYHEYRSADLGETWEFNEAAIQGDPTAVHPSPFLVVDPDNPGRVFALVSERVPADRISLWETTGDRPGWHSLGQVTTGNGDWTYPWMTHLGGNEWYLVYYQGSKESASIHGGKLTVPER